MELELTARERFLNRELSLLEFNTRVLAQARDESIPLLERLKYLCISCSNLDEFFEVRYAGLNELKAANQITLPDELQPDEAKQIVSERAHRLVDEQYEVLNALITPALKAEGIHFARRTHWTKDQREWLKNYFIENIQPVVSPLGVDPTHPFPRVSNRSLHFIVSVDGKDAFGRKLKHAIVQVPRSLPRVIQLPEGVADDAYDFVFLSSIIHAFVDLLFPGVKVDGCYQFRLTRNTDLFLDEDSITNLMPALQGGLSTRSYGDAVRLEVADNCPEDKINFLLEQFGLTQQDLYQVNGPVNLHRLMVVPDLVSRPDLKFKPHHPSLAKGLQKCGVGTKDYSQGKDLFDCIRKSDVMLHHPFESFLPVLEFLKQASMDHDVLSIRMTLYRTGMDSPIIDYLERAATLGKEVTVIIELKARFDEEANIAVAKRLQNAGANVVYGVVGHKTHAKMILIIRREQEKLRYYTHLGTGNYHVKTTRFYTDIGILSANRTIGLDVHRIFQQLTSLGSSAGLEKLLQAPFTLKSTIIAKLAREADFARSGKEARFIGKMNGLQETQIIEALYAASQAGVKIDLIVRGICCLRPGVPGLSENIRVISIIGQFLEHPRVFYFHNDGQIELYCSSADLMSRNLNRRVEVAFPVLDPSIQQRVMSETLFYYLNDNQQAWQLQTDGSYTRVMPIEGEEPFCAQRALIEDFN